MCIQSNSTLYVRVHSIKLMSEHLHRRYYFRVGNMESDVTYTFHIINLMKTDSLYNYGE